MANDPTEAEVLPGDTLDAYCRVLIDHFSEDRVGPISRVEAEYVASKLLASGRAPSRIRD